MAFRSSRSELVVTIEADIAAWGLYNYVVHGVPADPDALVELLARIRGATVWPAYANLALVRLDPPERASKLRARLAERGCLIKDVSRLPALEGCLRVSIGTPEEQGLLEQVLSELGELEPSDA